MYAEQRNASQEDKKTLRYPQTYLGSIVFNKFKIIAKLASGSFGEVYIAQSQDKTAKKYAIKAESVGVARPQILLEARIYKYLHNQGEIYGIPRIYGCGVEAKHNLMLMDLLGDTLQKTLEEKASFSL